MNKLNCPVQGLAEISLRIHDLDAMRRFYEEVIGFEVLPEIDENEGKCVFYTIGADNPQGGRCENMALFEETMMSWSMRTKSPQIDPKQTTLHHLAPNISLDDFESDKRRLEDLGIEIIRSGTSSWMRARMFYFTDPERNLIEYKSYD